jgi:uncharacterized membrane protein
MSSQVISQSEIVRKNTAAIADMQRKVSEARTIGGRIADAITDFTGSMLFVYVHVVWFAIWILLNVGLIHIPHISEFDPFPFSLLTMVVSLEAIFLSTFVLISQNRLACASEKRAELDLQVNLLAEQKATKVLEMLDKITEQLDQVGSRFNFKPDPEVKALKVSPEPQEVLQVIEDAAKDDAKETKKLSKQVEDITDEMEAVQHEVKHTSGKLDDVAEDVEELKQEVKGVTSQQERLSLK